MKLYFVLTISFALSPVCAAQSSVWKVEGKGNTIYIGGTMHLLSPEDYPLPVEFDSAYAWSDGLVLEADLKKMEDPAVVQRMMSMAMYQDERTLQSVLSEKVYRRLEAACAKIEVPITSLSRFKPTMVMLIISVTKMQQSGSTSAGVDQYYLSMALADRKPLLFLETVDSQLEMLFGEEDENEDQVVLQFLDELDQMDALGAELKANWLRGNEKIFRDLQKEMKKEYPEVYDQVLADRNNNWITTIDSYLDNEEVELVLVGALHVFGTDGIIRMLKKKGYKVAQMVL
ncbi:MAG: TraB/GumN family protein [Bacteroidota bacterium]